MNVTSREEARQSRLRTYFTGVPCPRGHVCVRITSNNECYECRLEKYRRYRAAHPEKVKAYSKKYWEMIKSGERKQGDRKAASRKYYLENRERHRELMRRQRAEKPEQGALHMRNRRARLREAGGSHTLMDIENIRRMQRDRCAYCRVPLTKVREHVDHITAVVNGGSNGRENLQILCGGCNMHKNAKDPIDFARSTGRLL